MQLSRKRALRYLALGGALSLCLLLSGCYIPPDDISGNTTNMTVGSSSLPFDPVATNAPTATPTPTRQAGAEPTINWDDWNSTATPAGQATASGNPVQVVTPNPVTVVTPSAAPSPTATTATTLRKGVSGSSEVRKLQQRLKDLKYYSGSVDGDFGTGTENAVKAFQSANGLTADGVAGSKTLNRLYSDNAVPNKGTSYGNVTATPRATSTPRPTSTPNVENKYLQLGSSGKDVRTMQTRLIALGWLSGSADGEFGSATDAAVRAFQKKIGVYTDGVAGPNTLKKLYSSSAPKTSSPAAIIGESLKLGSEGAAVRTLQKRLKELGYLTGSVDGSFGAATETAVKAFQSKNGLTADGKAGTSTFNKLYSDSAISASGDGGTTSDDGYQTLSEGDKGTAVRKLQQALKNKGYYSGSVDGSYGSGTVQAVMAFQQRNNLRVDGKAGPATQRVLYGTNAVSASAYTTLREGDEGKAVSNLQYALYELGYYDGKIDGVYGSTTRDAVRAFQSRNKVTPVDGIAGSKTQQKLYSSSAKPATAPATEFATLRKGDSGNAVVEMQDVLKQLGYLTSEVNGIFDDATVLAVRSFQQRNGLSVDGVAGSDTLRKLYSDSAIAY